MQDTQTPGAEPPYSQEYTQAVKKTLGRVERYLGICIVLLFVKHLAGMMVGAVASVEGNDVGAMVQFLNYLYGVVFILLIFLCVNVVRLANMLRLSRAATLIMAVLCFVIALVPAVYMSIQADKVLKSRVPQPPSAQA